VTILTAGYGNRGFDGFVSLVKAHGVTHLVDVRRIPQSSYWEDFRRERLQVLVPQVGLRYVYMGDSLGAPADDPLEPLFRAGIDKLIDAAKTRSICLMCGCQDPVRCHRFGRLSPALLAVGCAVDHLDMTGDRRPHAEILARQKLQGDLFSD